MKNTIDNSFGNRKLFFNSFNMFSAQLDNLIPTEVIFDVAKQPKKINGGNVFGKTVAIALKDRGKSGDYEKGVRTSILSLISSPKERVRSELAKFLRDQELMSVQDDELENCRVIAKLNNKFVTIHMLGESNYATKFQVEVPLKSDGHPEYEPLKKAAIKTLKEKVISRKEDV